MSTTAIKAEIKAQLRDKINTGALNKNKITNLRRGRELIVNNSPM